MDLTDFAYQQMCIYIYASVQRSTTLGKQVCVNEGVNTGFLTEKDMPAAVSRELERDRRLSNLEENQKAKRGIIHAGVTLQLLGPAATLDASGTSNWVPSFGAQVGHFAAVAAQSSGVEASSRDFGKQRASIGLIGHLQSWASGGGKLRT